MQVGLRAVHVDLDRARTFEADNQPRLILRPLGSVGTEDEVAGETLAVGGDEGRQLRASDLLLALEDELHVERQRARCPQERLDAEDAQEEVRLHVGGATAVEAAVANLRIERGRAPQVERIDGLNVEVTVDQHGGSARSMQPVSVDHGMPTRG